MKQFKERQGMRKIVLIRVLVAIVITAILLVVGPVGGNVFSNIGGDAAAIGLDNNFDRTFTNKAPLNAKQTVKLDEK